MITKNVKYKEIIDVTGKERKYMKQMKIFLKYNERDNYLKIEQMKTFISEDLNLQNARTFVV